MPRLFGIKARQPDEEPMPPAAYTYIRWRLLLVILGGVLLACALTYVTSLVWPPS
jgi:hypothetical protein